MSANFTRTRISDMRKDMIYTWTEVRNGVSIPGPKVVTGKEGVYKSIYDVNHRNFSGRRKQGEVMIGHLDLTTWERVLTSGSLATGTYNSYSNTWSGDLTSALAAAQPPDIVTCNESAMQQDVLTKAWSRMNASSICTGEILADIGKTVSMLKSPFKGACALLQKVLKTKKQILKRNKGIHVERAIADAWLEYRYGWKPILLDMGEIIDATHNAVAKMKTARLVARSEVKDSRSTVKSFVRAAYPAGWNGWKGSGSVKYQIDSRVAGGVLYEISNRNGPEYLLQVLGLRPRDVPATLWEVLPFSFVADWFSNVGNWLQAITPAEGIVPLGWWTTTIRKTITDYSGGPMYYTVPASPTPYEATGTWGSMVTTNETVSRRENPEITSHPVITAKTPSIIQAVDAVGLYYALTTKLTFDIRGRR